MKIFIMGQWNLPAHTKIHLQFKKKSVPLVNRASQWNTFYINKTTYFKYWQNKHDENENGKEGEIQSK